MRRIDYQYLLPPELIAQHPAARRDGSRLLVLDRPDGELSHHSFLDLPKFLRSGDVLCTNDTKVLHARLRAAKLPTGGAVELLLLESVGPNDWWVMLRPGKRVRPGSLFQLMFPDGRKAPWTAVLVEKNDAGHCRIQFQGNGDISDSLDEIGEVPLPPYIDREGPGSRLEDQERYQTVYARHRGSVAAPTAGLHFTPEVLQTIRDAGVETCSVTLHVGAGTFAPMKADLLADHVMHEERFEISAETARLVNRALAEGRRVVAVGTTTCRVLESVARWVLDATSAPVTFEVAGAKGVGDFGEATGVIRAGKGRTRLFLHPPASFHVVGALFTNFHLPESTLLMLVSAFASPGGIEGREQVLRAYAEAVRERYRFFSYGDAMFVQ
jgi:S-adenosylmethionine:tRNA ribosyltransferase-isomerase